MSFALSLLAIPVQAEAHGQADDLYGAMADFDQHILLDPKTGYRFNDGDLVHTAGGDFDRDPAVYDKAISLDPKNPKLFLARAYMYHQTGHSELALADCTTAISLDPNFADAYVRRA